MNGAGTIATRLAALPATRGTWRRVSLLSLGGFFEFYDLFLGTYVAPGLVKSGVLTTTTPGLFGTTGVAGFFAAFFAGLFVGTALFGFIADRLGRRSVFTWSLIWYAAASLVMAFQTDAFSLNVWRFICGIGVGVELVTIDTYIAEICPPAWRGRAFAYANVIQFMAIPLAALLGWLLVPRTILGLDGWRFVVMAGSAGALAAWWLRRRLPESPRWLAQHGRSAEAEEIVAGWELEARLEQPGWTSVPAAAAAEGGGRGAFMEILSPRYRGRTIMLIVFNLFQAAGYYGFASWVPTLLISQGIAVTTSLLYTFIIAIAAPIGPLLGLWFTGHIERKHLIVGAALAIATFGLLFTQARGMAGVIACGVALTVANNVLSFAYHGYQPELYPTRIRAFGVGFVYSFSRLSTMFSAFVIAAILRVAGAGGVFVFIAGCMAVVALVIGLFGPRTHGRPLEMISQ
ncbi:MAG: MFS transporter [Alphaproteobacteria bacterium 64-11]|nr:MFS transporter [Alphaproteobacteria bacterium]OJU13930.1 MAG: MFS transporter [Alphaproteobacteria bacterium 64-11]